MKDRAHSYTNEHSKQKRTEHQVKKKVERATDELESENKGLILFVYVQILMNIRYESIYSVQYNALHTLCWMIAIWRGMKK